MRVAVRSVLVALVLSATASADSDEFVYKFVTDIPGEEFGSIVVGTIVFPRSYQGLSVVEQDQAEFGEITFDLDVMLYDPSGPGFHASLGHTMSTSRRGVLFAEAIGDPILRGSTDSLWSGCWRFDNLTSVVDVPSRFDLLTSGGNVSWSWRDPAGSTTSDGILVEPPGATSPWHLELQPVPEPPSWFLLVLGAASVFWRRRMRRRSVP